MRRSDGWYWFQECKVVVAVFSIEQANQYPQWAILMRCLLFQKPGRLLSAESIVATSVLFGSQPLLRVFWVVCSDYYTYSKMKYKGLSRCLRDLSWQLIRIIIRQEVNINIIDKSNPNILTVKDLWQPTITLAKNGISGAKDKNGEF